MAAFRLSAFALAMSADCQLEDSVWLDAFGAAARLWNAYRYCIRSYASNEPDSAAYDEALCCAFITTSMEANATTDITMP